MVAIPVPSSQKPTNPQLKLESDQITDNDRRLKILERNGKGTLEERVTAIELFLFGP